MDISIATESEVVTPFVVILNKNHTVSWSTAFLDIKQCVKSVRQYCARSIRSVRLRSDYNGSGSSRENDSCYEHPRQVRQPDIGCETSRKGPNKSYLFIGRFKNLTNRIRQGPKDAPSAKVGSTACKIQTTPPTANVRRETVEILNGILPPEEWEEEGQTWTQQVSSTPATRLDVINLQEQLDMRLQQRQARETGICPVRRELYTQCFGIILAVG